MSATRFPSPRLVPAERLWDGAVRTYMLHVPLRMRYGFQGLDAFIAALRNQAEQLQCAGHRVGVRVRLANGRWMSLPPLLFTAATLHAAVDAVDHELERLLVQGEGSQGVAAEDFYPTHFGVALTPAVEHVELVGGGGTAGEGDGGAGGTGGGDRNGNGGGGDERAAKRQRRRSSLLHVLGDDNLCFFRCLAVALHPDVPDIRNVVPDAYQLVEDGLITEDDFKAFVFDNVVEMHSQMNSDFFKGTAVAAAVDKHLAAG